MNHVRIAVALLILCGQACAGDSNAPVTTKNGFRVHTLRSEFQKGPTRVRVLLPKDFKASKRYRVLYVLPVEAGSRTRYGDGLAVIKKRGLHNKHGLICVAPEFSHLPWYADHPTNRTIRQESYFLKAVIPLIEREYPAIAKRNGRLLVGFSKSGWGAFCLLLRNPETFAKAAAWDAPLMMDRHGRYGSGPIFGTLDNFQQYRVTALLEKHAKAFKKDKRLILTGYGNFRAQHVAAHALMKKLGIAHVYQDGPARKHRWGDRMAGRGDRPAGRQRSPLSGE